MRKENVISVTSAKCRCHTAGTDDQADQEVEQISRHNSGGQIVLVQGPPLPLDHHHPRPPRHLVTSSMNSSHAFESTMGASPLTIFTSPAPPPPLERFMIFLIPASGSKFGSIFPVTPPHSIPKYIPAFLMAIRCIKWCEDPFIEEKSMRMLSKILMSRRLYRSACLLAWPCAGS